MANEEIRFGATMPIIELEDAYCHKYKGSEADARFRPREESSLVIDVRIRLPHLIASNQEFKDRVSSILNRAVRDAVYECGKIGAEIMDKSR